MFVGAVVLLYKLMDRRVIDPTETADRRAREEAERRAADLKAAEARLKAEVETVRRNAAAEDKKDDAAAVDLAQDLAKDPEDLVGAMRNVGRGGKP